MSSLLFSKGFVRNALVCLVLGILAFLITFSIIWFNNQLARSPLTAIDNAIDDLAVQVRNVTAQDNKVSYRDIVIIDIDDYSIGKLGRVQLWPRKYDAQVINYISDAKPAVILLDALYTESDIFPEPYISLLKEHGFQEPESIVGALSTDYILSESIKRAGNIVMGMFDQQYANNSESSLSEYHQSLLPQILVPRPYATMYYRRSRPVLPIDSFAGNALSMGLLKVNSDQDGTVRKYTLLQRSPYLSDHNDDMIRVIPSFIIPAVLHILNLDYSDISVLKDEIRIADKIKIPVNYRSEFNLNWLGDSEEFRFISFVNVLDGSIPAAYFENKIVFIGSSAAGLEDLKNTPVNFTMPGVEVHATALYNIMNSSWLFSPDTTKVIIIMLFLSPIYSLLFLVITHAKALIFGVFLLFLKFFGYILVVLPEFSIVVPISAFLILTISVFITTIIYKSITEGKEKQKLKAAFSSYVSPQIVSELIESGEDPKLGGNEAEISAFFSDIQSFSRISEKLSPIQLVELMNSYLNVMTEIITEERGTLDKYIGDAIVAFYGAPVKIESHALHACITSQRMLIAQDKLIQEWKRSKINWPEEIYNLKTRIGINTGLAVTGNMGSSKRFNYTMMGDTVNLAARCETSAKQYGVYTLVTAEVKKQAELFGNDCVFRKLDRIRVLGRENPVDIFEVCGLKKNISDKTYECIDLFEKGFTAYQKMEWEFAIHAFEKSSELEKNELNPGKGIITNPSIVLLQRTHELKNSHLPPNWDGIYTMQRK